jgi:hypothetical protein
MWYIVVIVWLVSGQWSVVSGQCSISMVSGQLSALTGRHFL